MLVNEQNIRFKAVRASGPGGQRLNRRSTKVQAWVRVAGLPLSDIQKKLIRKRLAHRINHDDELEVMSEEERSQELNRDKAVERLNQLIEEAIHVPPPRISSEPPRSAENIRLKEKRIISDKKKSRRSGK